MPHSATQLLANSIRIFIEVQNAFEQCDPEIRESVHEMLDILRDENADDDEKAMAMHTVIQALFPGLARDMVVDTEEALRSGDAAAFERQMDADEATFADRVQQLMKDRGMTQTELAQRIGIGQPAVSNMLKRRCRPQDQTVRKVADALGVSPGEIWPPLVSEVPSPFEGSLGND